MVNEVMNRLSQSAADFFHNLNDDSSGLLGSLKRRGGYALLNRIIGRAVPFAARNQFQVLEMASGYLKAKIPLKGNTNHIGTMYAGAMFVLAEVPGGVLAYLEFGTDYFPVLREITLSYRRPAHTDVTIEVHLPPEDVARIRQEADRNGKSNFTLSAELRDLEGELVAQAQARYQLRKSGWHCGGA